MNRFDDKRAKVNELLKDFFAKKKKLAQKQSVDDQELIGQVESVTLRGGDKMRPLLVYFAYTAVKDKLSKTEENKLWHLALCTELFHTACLIHDDVMDKSIYRRGGLTIHEYFAKKYKNEKLGKDLAILAGDLALVWADEMFHDNNLSLSNYKKTQKYFNLLREEVIFGQQLDLLLSERSESKDPSAELQTIMKMYEYKTAKYSFERPIHLGLALAQDPDKTFAIFSKYALSVGVAFQIKDDILGSFGDTKKTGKSNEDDLREQKNTLLVAYAKYKMKNEKCKIDKKLLVSSGALKYCEDLAKKLVKEGKKTIKDYNISSDSKRFFLDLADYVVDREE